MYLFIYAVIMQQLGIIWESPLNQLLDNAFSWLSGYASYGLGGRPSNLHCVIRFAQEERSWFLLGDPRIHHG